MKSLFGQRRGVQALQVPKLAFGLDFAFLVFSIAIFTISMGMHYHGRHQLDPKGELLVGPGPSATGDSD